MRQHPNRQPDLLAPFRTPANDNQPAPCNDNAASVGSVFVRRHHQLLSVNMYRALAQRTVETGLSRREFPNWMADVIYGYRGLILYPEGTPFPLPDIDDLFNGDGSFRWIGSFKRSVQQSPKQQTQQRVLPRLQVICLSFDISDLG